VLNTAFSKIYKKYLNQAKIFFFVPKDAEFFTNIHTNIKNDLQSNQLREPFPIPQSFSLQNLSKFLMPMGATVQVCSKK
jgi:hypothetical protein